MDVDNTTRYGTESDSAVDLSLPNIALQKPPHYQVHDGPAFDNTVVSIELLNKQRLKGKLTRFDTRQQLIAIIQTSTDSPTEIAIDDIKYMRLEKPYQLALNDHSSVPERDLINDANAAATTGLESAHAAVINDMNAAGFEVYFRDQTELTGNTYGFRQDHAGIHIYEQTKVGRKWRYCSHLFVSKAAIDSYNINDGDKKRAGIVVDNDSMVGGSLSRQNTESYSLDPDSEITQIIPAAENQTQRIPPPTIAEDLPPDSQADQADKEELVETELSPLQDDMMLEGVLDSLFPLDLGSVENTAIRLASKKIAKPQDLLQALVNQKHTPNMRLGEILVAEKLVQDHQIADALVEQKKNRKRPLGEILVAKGVIAKNQIQQCLAMKLGIPFVSLREFPFEKEVCAELSADIVFQHKAIPIYAYQNKLVVALENPMDWKVVDTLSFHSNKFVEPVMASPEDINWALQFHYRSEDLDQTLAGFEDQQLADADEEQYDSNLFDGAETDQVTDNVVVRIVNKIIEDAHRKKVSDIHIEPGVDAQKVIVRFRKQGILTTYYKFPSKYRSVLVSRLKVMAQMDISNKNIAQEGKIDFSRFGSFNSELRLSTIPTAGGVEDVVIRIVSSSKCMPIQAIGLSTANQDKLLEVLNNPQGLFLVSGPTGAGKSTTLHALLHHLNDARKKIWTAEEPVEILQSGLRQVEVNQKSGMGYANAIQSFLRADPDIIMVGDMSEKLTASAAIEASLTGHLVLSALNTNGTAETVVRLLDMDMDSFNLADALTAVLSQRLIKTLCSSCKQPYQPSSEELVFLGMEYYRASYLEEFEEEPDKAKVNRQVELWRKTFSEEDSFALYKAPGCEECSETGYRGRIGVHELMLVTPIIKRMILHRNSAADIYAEAIRSGMRTRRQDAIEKVMLGYTDQAQIKTV